MDEVNLKKDILEFIKKNERVFTSDIAKIFNIPSKKATEILGELEKEKRIFSPDIDT